jgi:hypothetical protein
MLGEVSHTAIVPAVREFGGRSPLGPFYRFMAALNTCTSIRASVRMWNRAILENRSTGRIRFHSGSITAGSWETCGARSVSFRAPTVGRARAQLPVGFFVRNSALLVAQ